MNKNIVYLIIAVVSGILIGWLIYGTSKVPPLTDANEHSHTKETVSQMWTCSMHPQISKPEMGNCPICGMQLIAAASSADGLALNEIKMTKNALALANITTSVVGGAAGDAERTITLSGKIKINEESNAIQASYFEGRIEKLYIDFEGQEVRKGALLATIYSPELVANQQELLTAVSLRESQPALYKAVRNKLKLLKLTEQQINAIETSGKVQENFPIYATVTGTVSEKMASEGDYIKKGQPLLKVSDLNSVWAAFDVYENQIFQFKEGQAIKIVSNAYPNNEFDAVISFIDPVLTAQTRTVTLRATLKNTNGILKPGMFVKGNINTMADGFRTTFTIPVSAVMWTGERSLVYVKTNANEPIFEMREITLGNREGEQYEVIEGLLTGDEIVTSGTFTVDAAAQLQGKKSMMAPSVDAGESVLSNPKKMSFPKNIQDDFKEVLAAYLKMKDAFVANKAKEVSVMAKTIATKLNSVSIGTLGTMEKSHITEIFKRFEAISASENLKKQREDFVVLNEHMVPVIINIGNLDKNIFVQKCPMANNNKGAFWISEEKEIRNPYYGREMLTCGSVIKTLGD